MQKQFKQLFRKLDLDRQVRFLTPGDYRYLKNGIPHQSGEDQDGSVVSLRGNSLINNAGFEVGTKIIGTHYDEIKNRVLFWAYNANTNHTIYLMNDQNAISIVMRWSGFNFQPDKYITGIAMYGDIVVWVDDYNNYRKLNVQRAMDGLYPSPMKEEYITLIKPPPAIPLTVFLSGGANQATNNIKDVGLQFYYRYIYEDDEPSVWSATSKTIRPSQTPGLNGVSVSIETNPLNNVSREVVPLTVKRIEFAFRYHGTNEWVLYKVLDLTGVDVSLAGLGSHVFYNDVSGETISDLESFKWFDSVPNKGRALALMNNRLFTLNYEESYDKGSIDFNIALVQQDSLATLTLPVYERREAGLLGGFTSIGFYALYSGLYYKMVTYNTTSNNGVADMSQGYTSAELTQGDVFPITLVLESSAATVFTQTPVAKQVFKTDSSYHVGLMFFDFAQRHVGVYTADNKRIAMPKLTLPVRYFNLITYDLSPITSGQIPEWATHYAVVITKNLTRSFFLQHSCADVWYYEKDHTGEFTYYKSHNVKRTGIAIDISNLTYNKLGYTFNAGDKIKFPLGSPVEKEYPIRGQEGKFLLIDLPAVGDVAVNASTPTKLRYEIFTPIKSAQQRLFYEIGEKFIINNPGQPGRTLSKVTGTLPGDITVVNREVTGYRDTPYNTSDPYDSDNILHSSVNVTEAYEAMNPNDDIFNVWINDTGRATGEIKYARKQKKVNHIRWGQPFVQDSIINQLNVFEALDEYALPKESGTGVRLMQADEILVSLHHKETVALYINEGFVNTSEGNQFLAKTENVVGDDRRYFGGLGTYHPESAIEFSDRLYYFDIFKGTFVRRSRDGLTPISDLYGIRNYAYKLAKDYLPYKDTVKIVGGWDPKHDLYLCSFPGIEGVREPETLAFHEPSNSWIGWFDYNAEQYSYLNRQMISWKGGQLWLHDSNPIHNNFYGTQYNRVIEFEIAPELSKSLIWNGAYIDSPELYLTDGSNEVIIELWCGTQYSTINYQDLKKMESIWRSPIFRDINTQQLFDSPTRAKYEGDVMRGQSIKVRITTNRTDISPLHFFNLLYTHSEVSFN